MTDDEEENILSGEIGRAVQIGTVTGLLILGGRAEKSYMDIYDICDGIDTIEMCGGFDNDDTKRRILDSLPMFLLKVYHTFPDIIADNPKPLPYEKSIHQKAKECMDREILSNYMNNLLDEPIPKDTEGVKLLLDEDQQNYILGRRIKDEDYLESAKDKAVWVLYHAAEFRDHLNTRVLFKVFHNNFG